MPAKGKKNNGTEGEPKVLASTIIWGMKSLALKESVLLGKR